MTITPDQADHWTQTATPGPWYVHTDPDDPDGTFIYDDPGNMCVAVEPAGSAYLPADLDLIAAAPDLAQTIAGMRWEYTFQTRPRGLPWREWTTQEDWFDNHDAAYRAAMNVQDAGSFNCRLVRRLVGPAEVIE